MNKNTQVETAQKSQATNKNKTKVPTGKVTIMKETEARKKAREEQYRNFRIAALKRRCKRMGYDEEKTNEFIEKLKKQLNAPKEYSILIMLDKKDSAMMKEALAKAKINYKYHGDTYFSIDGNQDILTKIREIAPPKAKIYPYAKKMESVIPKEEPPKKVKMKVVPHSRPKGKNVFKKRPNIASMSKKGRKEFKAQVKSLRDKWKAEKALKKKSGTTVQIKSKKGSESLKKAA